MTLAMRPRDCVLLLLLPGIIALSMEFDGKRARSPLRTFTINGPHHFYSPFAKRTTSEQQKHLDHLSGIRPTQTTQHDGDKEGTHVQGSENNDFRPLWQWIHNQHHGSHHPGQGMLASHLHNKFTATETVISTVVIYVPDQAQQSTFTVFVPTTSYIVTDGQHQTQTVTTTLTSVINAGVTITEAEQLSGGEAVLHVDTVTRTRTITSVTTSTRTINAGVTITEAEQLSGGEVVTYMDTKTVTVPTTKTLLLPTTTVIVSQLPGVTRTSISTIYVPKTTTIRDHEHGHATVTRTTTRLVSKTSTIYVPTTTTVVSTDHHWTKTETVTLATATRTISEIVLKTTYLPTTVTVTDRDDEDHDGDGDHYYSHSSSSWPRPTLTITKTKTKTKTVGQATITSYVPDETWTVTSIDYAAPTVYLPSVSTVTEAQNTLTLYVPRTTIFSTSTTTVRVPTTVTRSCEPHHSPGLGHGHGDYVGGYYPPGAEHGHEGYEGGYPLPGEGHGHGNYGGGYPPPGEGHGHGGYPDEGDHGYGGGDNYHGTEGSMWPPTGPSYYPWPNPDYHQHTVTLTVPEACNPTTTNYETVTVVGHQNPDEENHGHYTRTTTVTKTKTNTLTVPSMKTETVYLPTTKTEIVEGFETVTLPASTVTVGWGATTTKTVTRWEGEEHGHHYPSDYYQTVTVTVWPSEEYHHPGSGHHYTTVTVPVTVNAPATVTKTKTKSTTVTRVSVTSVTKTVNLATTTVYYPDESYQYPNPYPHTPPKCNLGAIEIALSSLEQLVVKIQTLVIRLTENIELHPACGDNNSHYQRPPVGNLEAILSSLGELMVALKQIVQENCLPMGMAQRPQYEAHPPRPCSPGAHGDCHGSQINVEILASLTASLEDLIESVGDIIHAHEQDGHQDNYGHYGNSEEYDDDLRKQFELVKGLQTLLASQYVTDQFSDAIPEDQVASLLAQPIAKIGSLQVLMKHPENLAKKPLVLTAKLGQLVDDLNKIRSLVNATGYDDYDSKKLLVSDSAETVANSTQKLVAGDSAATAPTSTEKLTDQPATKTTTDVPVKSETTPFIVFAQNVTQMQNVSTPRPVKIVHGRRNSTSSKRRTPSASTPNVATTVGAPLVKNPVNVESKEGMILISEVKKSIVPQEIRSSTPTSPATTGKRRKSKISSDEWS